MQQRGPRVQDLALVGLSEAMSEIGPWASYLVLGGTDILLLLYSQTVRIEAFIKPRCDHLEESI